MKPVLLDIEPGREPLATTVGWAAALRLLSRGALGPVRLLAPTRRSRRLLGSSLPVVSEKQAPQAIRDSSLLVLAGTLADTKALERAARWVIMAKEAGVPVALAAVRLPAASLDHPALAVLAQCDSVSAGDAQSARCLAALRRDRIECTAPLELLLECDTPCTEPRPFTVGLCAHTMRRGGRPLRQMLQQLARDDAARIVVLNVGGARRRQASVFDEISSPSWNEAMQAVARCDLFVAEPDSMWLHMAAAVGAAPVAWLDGCERSALHERLGLHDLVLSRDCAPGTLATGFCREGSITSPTVRRRIATLRMVAWRSLGILAQAVRSTPLDWEALDLRTRRFVAQIVGRPRLRSEAEPATWFGSAGLGEAVTGSTRSVAAAFLNRQNEPSVPEELESGRSPCVSKP